MQPFRYHVFACEQKKPDGLPCCHARGSAAVIDALRREVAVQRLGDTVQVTACGSLGLCEKGPNLVVYPEGTWYSGVQPEDVPEIVREHLAGGRPVARLARVDEPALRAEIDGNRQRYLDSLRAREGAGVVPDELMQTVRGYQASRIVLTALELDVFSVVGSGATAAHVCEKRQASVRGVSVLLDALVALGLLTKSEGAYVNGPAAERWLCAGARDDARDALKHHLALWGRWSTLTACVRAGHSVMAADAERSEEETVSFTAAMDHNARLRAPLVARVVGAERVRRLLDVGGGSGAYAIAFAQANPALQAEILDRPAVFPLAQRYVEQAGVAHRVEVRVADLRRASLGEGWDVVLVSAICHMLGPEENRDLFRRAAQALAPGGRLVVQDFVVDEDRTTPAHAALFAVNMLVGTTAGSTWTEEEYLRWMRDAGFASAERVALPGPTALIIATR